MTPTEIAAAVYIAITALLAVGVHLHADDEDLDNRGLMFTTALMLLLWPVTVPLSIWHMRRH